MSNEYIKLVNVDGTHRFALYITNLTDCNMWFKMYEAGSWNDNGNPLNTEHFVTGNIKRDGCMDIDVGEDDEHGCATGYMHLCGFSDIKAHNQAMEELFAIAASNIARFDNEIAY